jgi:GTP diphosphokinase / guanosine-3',5'-bis(diphosphate) 3'-diphosphatase
MTAHRLSDMGRLLQAAHFSADKHRDQRRKGIRNTPYINHPLEVAERLNRIAGIEDATVLIAAILHDTIEDTETTQAELTEVFGAEVAAIVVELSENKALHWTERKRIEIDDAATLSPAAKLIKLSDKTSNVHDTVTNPPADWTIDRRRDYLIFAGKVADNCRGQNQALDAEFDRVLAAARRKLK